MNEVSVEIIREKICRLPQRLAHEMRVALQVNDRLVHAQTMQKAEGRMKN
jgi:hypothetical protein